MPEDKPSLSPDVFRLLTSLISDYAGLYFPPERAQSVATRLAPRLEEMQCGTFLEYYHLLKYDGGSEIVEAIERLTNHETYFLRETPQLLFITELVRQATKRLRVLSAGCSTGEEPYSLAMLLDQAGLRSRADIVGIDISGHVIERAKEGAYTAYSFRGVEGALVDQYFTPEGGVMRIDPKVRRAASFEQMNLLDAGSLGTLGLFDVVLCRNVLIHFAQASKAKAIAGMVNLLPEGGYLFLGHSESLFDIPNALEMVRAGSVIAHRRPSRAGAS